MPFSPIRRSSLSSSVRSALAVCGVALWVAGCQGSIADDQGQPRPATGTGGTGAPGKPSPGTGGTGGSVVPGTGGSQAMGGAGGTMMPPSGAAVSHLTCDPKLPASGPRRIWRLKDVQYRNSIAVLMNGRQTATKRDLLAPAGMSVPFDGVNTADRFSNYAASYSMNDYDFRESLTSARDVAEQLVAQWKKEAGSCLAAGGAGLADCVKKLASERGPLLFRRPLTTEETAHFAGIVTRSQVKLGDDGASVLAFQAMLLSPNFLYRSELGDAEGKLTPYEIASALSYALTDYPPDEELWRAADAKALSTPEQIRAHVDRLLGSSLADRASVMRFFREYLGYEHTSDVFKDAKDFPYHKPELLEQDTALWLKDLLATSGRMDVLKTLLTSRTGFVRYDTATNYNLKAMFPSKTMLEPQKVTFASADRAGILTQPSLLSALSTPNANEPVQRGRFVAESLLCQEIPELPIGQVPQLPNLGPDATLRDRLKMHSADPACWACHKMMDPLGLGFENYDHTGIKRTTEAGKPVVATGELYGTGTHDGPFNGAVELAEKLAAAPSVAQCFTRHAFRYWMGREETAADGCSILDANAAFAKNGDYAALVASLFTSRSFLVRGGN